LPVYLAFRFVCFHAIWQPFKMATCHSFSGSAWLHRFVWR
jgi:hypothetical protein